MIPFALSALALIIGFSLYYVRLAGIENTIAIHFIGGYGADIFGGTGDVLGMLFFGTLIWCMNLILTATIWNRNRALSRIISIITLVLSVLIVTAVYGIITIN